MQQASDQLQDFNKKITEKFMDMTKMNFSMATPSFLQQQQRPSRTSTGSAGEGEQEQFQLENFDHSAVEESDQLFQDCGDFVQLANKTIELAKKNNSSRPLLNTINKWRVKGKGNKLNQDYESIVGRFDGVEKKLKEYTDRSLSDCQSFMLQAGHLRSRLSACITFNKSAIEVLQPKLDSAREYANQLDSYQQHIEFMCAFHDEVKRQKDNQVEPYVPWAMRAAMAVTHPPIKVINFNRAILEKRSSNIDRVNKDLFKLITKYGKIYDKRCHDLEHCSKSLAAMESLLVKLHAYRTIVSGAAVTKENPIFSLKSQSQSDGDASSSGEKADFDSDNIADDGLPDIEAYDHTHCADCACVYALGNDCSMSLAAIQHFAEDSTKQLHKLFSIREKVKDKARELEKIEWGEHI